MKAVAGILLCLAIVHVFADDCDGETSKELGNGVVMICRKGVWRVSRRSMPKNQPCMDDLSSNSTCSADRGACLQYTDAGKKADLDCPETCESCDACRCQDASQWHTYCPFWSQYCSSSGVLGTWMTSNCRKTCGKCKCKCCSYDGKQHQLGARIPLPDKCGELICQEGLIAGYSPLLSGAVGHKVSHPEELTLNFQSVHDGADCCILPGNARNANGSSSPNGTMVQEGWKGLLDNHGVNVPTSCCHGVLCTPLNGTDQTSSTTTTLTTTTTTTTTSNIPRECSRKANLLSSAPAVAGFEVSAMVLCDDPTKSICEKDLETICPAGYHLCSYPEFINLNDNWNFQIKADYRPVGEIYCRTRGSNTAGHFTLGQGKVGTSLISLSYDESRNHWYGSSRPQCNKYENIHACNEKHVTALCCSASPNCGNGVLNPPLEECDDGNQSNNDDCLNTCTFRISP